MPNQPQQLNRFVVTTDRKEKLIMIRTENADPESIEQIIESVYRFGANLKSITTNGRPVDVPEFVGPRAESVKGKPLTLVEYFEGTKGGKNFIKDSGTLLSSARLAHCLIAIRDTEIIDHVFHVVDENEESRLYVDTTRNMTLDPLLDAYNESKRAVNRTAAAAAVSGLFRSAAQRDDRSIIQASDLIKSIGGDVEQRLMSYVNASPGVKSSKALKTVKDTVLSVYSGDAKDTILDVLTSGSLAMSKTFHGDFMRKHSGTIRATIALEESDIREAVKAFFQSVLSAYDVGDLGIVE